MPQKKYTLKYLNIQAIPDDIDLMNLLVKTSPENKQHSFSFHDERGKDHNCVFNCIKFADGLMFGKFGEIKESLGENGAVIINNKELTDVDFKYNVQFLIDPKRSVMVYIFNTNAICFEEAFKHIILKNSDLFSIILEKRRKSNLIDKVKKSRRIKFFNITTNSSNEKNTYFTEFKDKGIFKIDVKIHIKKSKNFTTDDAVDFISNNKNSNDLSVGFVDEDGIDYVKHFSEDLFFETRKIQLERNDIKDNERIFDILKTNLEAMEDE